ncbi:MAG: hypothetical protein WBO34_05060 [Gammaproteobacteria bacterium]
MNHTKIITGIICTVSLLFGGCTALKTFPTAARPGETVALAVGSPDNLTMANVNSVTFVSAAAPSTPKDITPNVRSIFKLYADKASTVYENPGVSANQIVRTGMHEPWLTVMAIDMPEDLSPGMPLPTGPGTITINTNSNVTYPTIGNHINSRTIAIEILPEASPTDGVASVFEYEFGTCCTQLGNLSLLEARPHALVRSQYNEDPFTLSSYAAMEMKINFAGTTDIPITDSNVKVVVDDMTLYSNSNRQIITSVNNEVLTVILISLSEKLKPYEMRFAVALDKSVNFTGPAPVIASTDYYDLNGASQADSTTHSVELR